MIYIYALTDPVTREIRYVGKTIDPNVREIAHKTGRSGQSTKDIWVQSLRAAPKFGLNRSASGSLISSQSDAHF
jgi:hypothetical protein